MLAELSVGPRVCDDHAMPRRVVPDIADTTIADAYASPLGAPTDRPWVGLCMVSSIDGSTVVDGRSTGLSSDNDIAVLHGLRSIADVIIVGAGTVRGEGYGPPKTQGQRVGVVTASGSIDLDIPLFTSGAGFIITTANAELGASPGTVNSVEGVEVIRSGVDRVDLAAAIARLDEVHARPRFVQVEGGAHLNGAMLDADVFDEINLTTSPLCVGGSGPRLTTGATDLEQRFELAQMVIDDESFVFSRWLRRR
jgi:riboflavin biosynthesis pyrimidine reductase